MKTYSSTALKWGNDPVPNNPNKTPQSWKFLNLHHPISEEYGGHYGLTGSYNGHFYGPDQVAICPDQEALKKHLSPGEVYTPDHQIPGAYGVCTCGIHSQTLQWLRDHQEFNMNTLAQMEMPGVVRSSPSGYRHSHARVLKLYTALPLDDQQLAKAQNDLRIPIERVPTEYITNHGSPQWHDMIDNHPELKAALDKDNKDVADQNARIAGPCPSCNNEDTTLIQSNSSLRNGYCPSCNTQWTQEEARNRRDQQNG